MFKKIIKNLFLKIIYGGKKFYCPVCDKTFGKFKTMEGSYYIKGELLDHTTKNAICPNCGSQIRHRLLVKHIKDENLANEKTKTLHFAPEFDIRKFFMRKKVDYNPVDFNNEKYNFPVNFADITALSHSENTFDLIVCSHVLEHIVDDIKAISELFRITKPGGVCLIALPIYGEQTYEDLTLDAAGRLKMFGIDDHQRLNGLDIIDKLKKIGFKVKVIDAYLSNKNIFDHKNKTLHTSSDRYLFHCEK